MDNVLVNHNDSMQSGDDLDDFVQMGPPEDQYHSRFLEQPRYRRLADQKEPIHVSGRVIISDQRKVLWKKVCVIGEDRRECLIEMSNVKLKFYIVALDLESGKYHVIEMWKAQASKILDALDKSMEKLMGQLEFKYGKLMIRDHDMLLQHQLYQPIPKASKRRPPKNTAMINSPSPSESPQMSSRFTVANKKSSLTHQADAKTMEASKLRNMKVPARNQNSLRESLKFLKMAEKKFSVASLQRRSAMRFYDQQNQSSVDGIPTEQSQAGDYHWAAESQKSNFDVDNNK